jgi:hypothetical protein
MIPPLAACAVLSKTIYLFDAQLPPKNPYDGRRRLRQILRKGSKVANGTQLYCEGEPIVIRHGGGR